MMGARRVRKQGLDGLTAGGEWRGKGGGEGRSVARRGGAMRGGGDCGGEGRSEEGGAARHEEGKGRGVRGCPVTNKE